MSKIVREIKNVTKGYSNTQIKVRNATSNDPWGPTGTEMSEIARMTFDTNHDFFEIMEMLDRRLNDKGKNWRHVLKALKVLDYCLHEGSAHVVVWAKDNIYIIKTLREFQYIDEEGKDQGLNVRIAAKELTGLILDEERLRNERKDRKSWKARVAGLDEGISSEGSHNQKEQQQHARRRQQRPARNDDEDLEYRLAIEASKNLAEEEAAKKRTRNNEAEDDDLEKAIRLSKEEEEQRQRELEQTNENTLFDENPTPTQSQPSQQPPQQNWQQGQPVDLFGNPIQSQQTAFLSNVYSQQPGLDQPQYGQQPGGYVQGPVATGWGVPSQFPQPTGFDQQPQQQPQQPQQQAVFLQPQNTIQPQSTLQPQQTAFGAGNPFATAGFNQQATGFLTPDTSNPYGNNQLSLQPQPEALKPMPTGSNNPFAQFSSAPAQSNGFNSVSPQRTAQPTLSQLQQNQTSGYPSAFQQQPNPTDQKHAQLNALLAVGNESGQDTFGNIGNLRIPAQHTAPGTFVNSAGTGRTGLGAQATGNNPFLNSQFTGVPQQQFPQQNRMIPAATGPAGINGFGQPNPYGGFPGQPQQQQQQQQQQHQSTNLIDF
ncbi:hypothetical protein TWF106_003399 [Orbilia oligospora]|uniref:ENTH domain-containing protein n=1 Tax=Orbilia oligospora TaxID=2813651 RepID=A0A7C8U7X1_ORBOL|nr:hypothetical protein TWF679_004564 [Orbilia oligospora]KAF3200346.1 hypothetical protein TWF106_003399 [Orbilia oligospora]